VAKDSARPFIVHSDSTEVRAVGTQFDVYRKETGTIVTVVEGRVAVVSPLLTHEPREIDRHARVTHASGSGMPHVPSSKLTSTPEQGGASGSGVVLPDPALLSSERDAVFLDADEQLSVSAGASREPIHTDSAAATAWTQHEIVFASTPLSEVATEFNRYNTRPLVIPNAAVRGIHITGVFSSADAAPLLKFLRAQHDIAVQETDEDIRILKK
jgi:transmembrane sensor